MLLPDDMVSECLHGASLEARDAAFVGLARMGALPLLADDADLPSAVAELVDQSLVPSDSVERLRALVMLIRWTQALQQVDPDVGVRLSSGLEQALTRLPPPLSWLDSLDDRRLCLTAVLRRDAMGPLPWIPVWLCEATVYEPVSETIRAWALRRFCERAGRLSQVFVLLSQALDQWTPGGPVPGDEYARRVRLIVDGLLRIVHGDPDYGSLLAESVDGDPVVPAATTALEFDGDCGRSLAQVLRARHSSAGASRPDQALASAHAGLRLLVALLQWEPALGSQVESYHTLLMLRGWLPPAHWNHLIQTRPALWLRRALAQTLAESGPDSRSRPHLELRLRDLQPLRSAGNIPPL